MDQASISGGAASSWGSFESVPPPPTPYSEQSPLVGSFDSLSIDNSGDEAFYGETNVALSLAVGKDEEVTNAFKEEPSKNVFRRISNPEINLGSKSPQVNGSSGEGSTNSSKPKSLRRFFTLALPSLSPKDRLKTVTPSSSNNHVSDDDDPAIIGSSKEDEIFVSPSYSDSAGEDAARLSSNPLCSSQVPEHTLSDISGPCSSSIVDKVPACLVGEKESVDDEIDEAEILCPELLGRSLGKHSKCVEGGAAALDNSSTTSSSSSISDSVDADELEERGIVCGSLKDELPPPLDETEEEDVVPMTVDTCEDYFTRLHDIRINGCVLEYTGNGSVGSAQSNVWLTPNNHYFEITIMDPGENCYIAIGLARKDYNMQRSPGWSRGSVAFHCDDGKIFIGGGVGTPFGPRCSTNDVLGCGIIFPGKYGDIPEGTRWPWEISEEETEKNSKTAKPRLPTRHRRKARAYSMDNFGDLSSESEDDIWWNNTNQVCEDKVKVFFMRNHKLLGIKEIRIPKGGFFPTVGMMSTNERVSVDLHPLSG